MARKMTQQERQAEKLRIAAMVVSYFDTTYGRNATRLDMWQQLCRDVVVVVGSSIKQCQKNLRGKFVCIVDYVNAKKDVDGKHRTFHCFGSPKELSDYIKKDYRRMFPRDEAKKNPILRWMLIHLC